MQIKIRHLEVFHAVMEEGSVSKAAERLNLSQPAVSIALSNLEDLLGFPLFHRAKGHFSPRPEAFQLHADAELSIMAVERFANMAKLVQRGALGYIRVGSFGGAALSLLPGLLSRFSDSYPQVQIDLQVRSSAQIAYLVGNGQLDLGLVEAPAAAANISTQEFESECVCIMREDDALAAQATITPHDLEDRSIVGIDAGNQVERELQRVCNDAGVELRIGIRGFFFAVVRRIIAEGGGIALVDRYNGLQNLGDGVVARPFLPAVPYRVALIANVEARLSQPAIDLSERVVQALSAGSISGR